MHDVTEGGVLGAIWEVAQASGIGVEIYKNKIPVTPETISICNVFDIDPLKLISSGCMLITTPEPINVIQKLETSDIKATLIGKCTAQKQKVLISENHIEQILEPDADELFKII
jgi:hydrogenase maturation factor